MCNLYGCLKVSLCIYLVVGYLALPGFFTVNAYFFSVQPRNPGQFFLLCVVESHKRWNLCDF